MGNTLKKNDHMSQVSILDKFPKKRIELPEAFQKIYNQHYLCNRAGKYKTNSLSQKLESWMHKKTAEDVAGGNQKLSTLEIGAGTLNQLQYEPVQGAYDIVEPFKELLDGSPLLKNIRNVYNDINDVNNIKYDRITSVATFEHIKDLPWVVSKAAMLLNEKNGHLRVAIPNEGTIMWKLGTMVTGYEFKKKYGLDYQVLMQYEHVNTAREIEEVLNYFFESTKCSVFGISKGLAFYRFYDCSEPSVDRVNTYFTEKILAT
jgi:hypothetical protein